MKRRGEIAQTWAPQTQTTRWSEKINIVVIYTTKYTRYFYMLLLFSHEADIVPVLALSVWALFPFGFEDHSKSCFFMRKESTYLFNITSDYTERNSQKSSCVKKADIFYTSYLRQCWKKSLNKMFHAFVLIRRKIQPESKWSISQMSTPNVRNPS